MVLNLLRACQVFAGIIIRRRIVSFAVRDKRSLDFTVTRSFMKLLRTGSAAVVDECQKFFRFLPPGLLSPLYWTGLTLLNGFSFLVIFYFCLFWVVR